ncbi:sensor of ECF-type sigma factor [Seonamhaeicola sp.]|uniref:Spy/CpxP family protein refolding chaperone n=1 Tax=Seonamhaeicola sp. TaxID=1912245 RepID=UPI002622B50C|nr:sensor of ECF-type sigma factor [Seonamhaeicola sp.]
MKTYLLPIIIVLFSLNLSAQQHDRDKIEALKVSFITEKLDLTKAEAQKFWPLYNEFDKTNGRLRFHEMRNIRKEIKDNLDTLSEERAVELLKKLNNIESRLNKNRMEFAAKVRAILPAKKIIKLKIAEDDFKRKMFNQWKNRKGGGKQGNKP